jgi:DnaJ-class molecular chaperone
MTVQKAELVTCETSGCYGTLIYLGGTQGVTARDVASASGWQVGEARWRPWDVTIPDVCPACLAGRGPITKTPCPSCGGFGGNLVCVYCGAEQPRDVED